MADPVSHPCRRGTPSFHSSSSSSSFSLFCLLFLTTTTTLSSLVSGEQIPNAYFGLDDAGNLRLDAPAGKMVVVDGVEFAPAGTTPTSNIPSCECEAEVKALRERYKAEVSVLQRVLCDAGVVDTLSVAQSIDTVGVRDFEFFEISGENYLAAAHNRITTDGGATITYSLKSPIYKWNNASASFEQHQLIDTIGAAKWTHFAIEGSGDFLALANEYNGNSFSVKSSIYRWNRSTKQFEVLQTIDTQGALDWEEFKIGDKVFLAVANRFGGGSYNIMSVVYQWNALTEQFDEAQQIGTSGAYDWEHVEIDGDHFIVVAHFDNGNSFNIPSVVYKYNTGTGKFDSFQSINTKGAVDWEHFEIEGATFLVVANSYDGMSRKLDSVVYKYDTSAKQFQQFQLLSTAGADHWEHFVIAGVHYLGVANSQDGSSRSIPSDIYKWNGSKQQFEKFESIETVGARDVAHGVIEGVNYLAAAHYTDGSKFDIPSFVYRWNPICAS